MTPPSYLQGDATSPQAKGPKVIAHICNDLGGWGKGFVVAISRRWPEPEREYRAWHRGRAGNAGEQPVREQPRERGAAVRADYGH